MNDEAFWAANSVPPSLPTLSENKSTYFYSFKRLFLRPKKQTLPSCPGYQTQEPSKALQNIQEIPEKREYIIFIKSKIYVVV